MDNGKEISGSHYVVSPLGFDGVLFPENTSGKKRELDLWILVRNCRKGDRKNDFGDITAEKLIIGEVVNGGGGSGERVETKYIRNEMACKRKFIYRDAILVEAPDGYKKQKKCCGTKELKKGGGVKGANKGKDSASCARNADQIATGRQENTCKDEVWFFLQYICIYIHMIVLFDYERILVTCYVAFILRQSPLCHLPGHGL